jgi:hypothetical protein
MPITTNIVSLNPVHGEVYYIEEEKDEYTIDIKISDPQKMGDGMGAYMVYRVRTKVS